MAGELLQRLNPPKFSPEPADASASQVVFDVATGYNLIADSYDSSEWRKFWDRNEMPIYSDAVKTKVKKYQNALDLGCGTGRYVEVLESVFSDVIGIDISRQMLRIARKKTSRSVLIEDDINNISELFSRGTRKFDFVSIARVLSHIKNPDRILKFLCEKLLVNSGVLVFSDIHPQHVYINSSFKHDGHSYDIVTYKHDVSGMIAKIDCVDWTYKEYFYSDLRWKPAENKLSSIDRHSRLPIFYSCVGVKRA